MTCYFLVIFGIVDQTQELTHASQVISQMRYILSSNIYQSNVGLLKEFKVQFMFSLQPIQSFSSGPCV